MSDVNFDITTKMVTLVTTYEDLKSKHLRKHNVNEYCSNSIKAFCETDTYLKTITSNLFTQLAEEVGKPTLDFTQYKWIKDAVTGRNPYMTVRRNFINGKQTLISTRMEQPHTIQGKDGAPEINNLNNLLEKIEGGIPVFDKTEIPALLERESNEFLSKDIMQSAVADTVRSKSAETMQEYALQRRTRLEEVFNSRKSF